MGPVESKAFKDLSYLSLKFVSQWGHQECRLATGNQCNRQEQVHVEGRTSAAARRALSLKMVNFAVCSLLVDSSSGSPASSHEAVTGVSTWCKAKAPAGIQQA